MKRVTLLLLAVGLAMGMISDAPAGITVLIDDQFDDGNVLFNANGIGSDYTITGGGKTIDEAVGGPARWDANTNGGNWTRSELHSNYMIDFLAMGGTTTVSWEFGNVQIVNESNEADDYRVYLELISANVGQDVQEGNDMWGHAGGAVITEFNFQKANPDDVRFAVWVFDDQKTRNSWQAPVFETSIQWDWANELTTLSLDLTAEGLAVNRDGIELHSAPWDPSLNLVENWGVFEYGVWGAVLNMDVNDGQGGHELHSFTVVNATPDDFVWNGQGNGLWSESRWNDPLGNALAGSPGQTARTTIGANTVTVAEPQTALSLTVDGGEVQIAGGQSLTVLETLDVATTLGIGVDAALTVGSGTVDRLTTAGNANISVTDTLRVTTYDAGNAGGLLVKQGGGTLALDNSGGTGVLYADNLMLRVDDGTLEVGGNAPLGTATGVTLNGGKLAVVGEILGYQPGLMLGSLSGNMNQTDPNPGNLGVDPLGPTASEGTIVEPYNDSPWGFDTTLVYTGEFYDEDGIVSFYENVDDRAELAVGNERGLLWDTSAEPWGNPTSTGTVNLGPGDDGWHYFELRMSNGVGEAGTAPGTFLGFGFDPSGVAVAADETLYTTPQNADAQTDNVFRTYEYGDVDMSGYAISVTDDSQLEVRPQSINADFGTLTMESGILTTSGAPIVFDATVIAPESSAVGFNPQTTTELGVITADDETPLKISKTGDFDLVLRQEPVGFGATTLAVEEGRLIGLPAAGNPFGSATLELQDGEIVLSSSQPAGAVFDNRVTVQGDGIISASRAGMSGAAVGPVIVTLGSPEKGITLNGNVELQSADAYTLLVAGNIEGPGTMSVDQGHIVLTGQANSVGSLEATGGILDTDRNDVTVNDQLTINNVSYSIGEQDSFKVSGADLANPAAPHNITIDGGTLRVGVPSSTAAYWKFEEGAIGSQTDVYQQDVFLDSSGNGNHLWTWSADTAPTYTADVPFNPIPQTGADNNAALDFTPNDDLYSNGKAIESQSFEQITVEASVKLHSDSGWQVIVGKDGKPTGDDQPPFYFKFRDDSKQLEAMITDGAGNAHWLTADFLPEMEQWYHLAFTSDGSTASFYVKGPNDADYVEWVTTDTISGGALIDTDNPWTVGRGQWAGGNADWISGVIDDVRISTRALDPSEFLANPGAIPPPLAISNTNLLVSDNATLQLDSGSNLPSTVGDLVVAEGVTLNIVGSTASFNDVTTGNGATLSGRSQVRGTLLGELPGATLNINGYLVLAQGSTFAATLGAESSDMVLSNEGVDIGIGTTLAFQIDGKHPFLAGEYTLIEATGEDQLSGKFATVESLGSYATSGVDTNGLLYSDESLKLTIDFNLHPGDADLNATTDVRDFNVWNTNKFTTGTDWTSGDFDGNGVTDVRDFNVWNTAKFTSATVPGAPAAGSQVPEPGTLMLLALGVLGLFVMRRRR